MDAFAYNGQIPGPRLRVTEGDHVRITVHSQPPETITVHWGTASFFLTNMDGPAFVTESSVPGARMPTSSRPIRRALSSITAMTTQIANKL